MKFDLSFISEPGARPENQDAIGTWPTTDGGIAIAVADGVGGNFGGETAASIAVQTFGDEASRSEEHPELALIGLEAHFEIKRRQAENPSLRAMATTLSAAVINPSHTGFGALLRFIHCGDTRIAVQRGQGIKKLTQEHSEAQRLLDEGLLTKEEFLRYPRKNVLISALGINGEPRIDYGEFDLNPGDRVFITSDEAHSKILLREMLELSIGSGSAEQFIAKVADEIRARGPEDNVTVAAIFLPQHTANQT